ncbi:hypothetical protein G1K75_09505 [Tenacibaculum finnmarkense]|uniref:DUF2829 domain-containing protein n=1 Tax=Tenacibaculum finnmarkense TaxID=2781243 RepID=UPI001E2ECE77|nr:DUF2829 domain-containing protein [Tenacibaculum finnmarkense]MCD8405799.1 DUF2829 domain-containing protein [Tenacibaculum dicentrarchi]MCG8805891.1 hypothetical protein [Tenacibaculum finnmarkense]MCG8838601.1 hypothetical protein [Tenacibaculum dicentrarchi]
MILNSFSEAFKKTKAGQGSLKMRLVHWSKDVMIKIQYPDEKSKMTAPYLYVQSRFGNVPWIPTQIELFSNEWEVVN